jgi:WD40 repeat protein
MTAPEKAAAAADPTKTHVARELKHGSPLVSCRFDPTGRFVFAGAQDSTVQRWDLESGKQTALAAHDSWVRAIGVTPDGQTLLTGDYQGRLIWWPATEEQPAVLRNIEAHQGWLRALRVTADGSQVITCGNDLAIRIWSTADGSLVRELKGHESHVYNLALHPRGEHLASIDLKGVIKHWDLTEGKELRQLTAPDLHKYDTTFLADIGGARGLEFNADGTLLACGGITNVSNAFAGIGNPAVVLFDWEKGEKKLLWRPKEDSRGSIWGLNFHAAGFLVSVTGGGGGGFLQFYKPEQAEPFFQFKLPNTGKDMHLAADGLRVAVAHHDGALRVAELRAKAA